MIAVIAILCQISSGSCTEEVVTRDAGLFECAMQAQQGVAQWMGDHPRYRNGWRVARIRCAPADYRAPVKV